MVSFEFDEVFEFPVARVFEVLTDLPARASWLKGITEDRVSPQEPVHLGTRLFEAGNFSGFKSEKTLVVSEFEQDRLLTLTTPEEVRQSFKESYKLEQVSEKSCRIYFTIEIGGAPKVAEFFMRQSLKKDLSQNSANLKAVLAKTT